MFPYFSFFLGDQLRALGYRISGVDNELRAGHRRYNFGWYRVADGAAPWIYPWRRCLLKSAGKRN